MKIKVEVSPAELAEMRCDTPEEFATQLRHQLDNGIVSNDGEAGTDWMCRYELDISLADGFEVQVVGAGGAGTESQP